VTIDRSTRPEDDGIELLIQALRAKSLEPFRNSGQHQAFSLARMQPPIVAPPPPGDEPDVAAAASG
jgi:hypothetical protein